MKTKTFFSLAVIAAGWGLMCSTVKADADVQMSVPADTSSVMTVITRYDVKQAHSEQFQKALHDYVTAALADDNNIMAEAYSEEQASTVLWVIERWNNKTGFDHNRERSSFKTLHALSEHVLLKPEQEIFTKDLEPISKKQWRMAAAPEDTPLTVMLFVNAKPGTGNSFKKIYHTAMPQFRGEPGVINYQLSQFENDSTQFVTYEKFRNEDAFQYHLNFPPIQPVIGYLNTSIKEQPFQIGLHRLIPLVPVKRQLIHSSSITIINNN